MIIIGQSSAVLVTHVQKDERGYNTALDWRTVSINGMLEFWSIETEPRTRKRKRA